MIEAPLFPVLENQLADDMPSKRENDSEVVIAFVAAVGVNLKLAEDAVASKLERIGYTVVRIRVTEDVLPLLDASARVGFTDDFKRIWTMMNIGSEARRKHGEEIIALGIAAAIKRKRSAMVKPQMRTAYLVHSLKHPEEVKKLRELYPLGFYLIGVHSPPDSRRKHLMSRVGITESLAKKLMDRDKKEDHDFGQQLVDTFHLSDFFAGWREDDSSGIDGSYLTLLESSIERFIEIIFGHPNRTPAFGEYAMYLAFAASLRSADLSRQVGAVIAREGEIIGTGANDCPKPGGGLYWPELSLNEMRFNEEPRGRDWTRKVDSNRLEQLELTSAIVKDAREQFTDELTKLLLEEPDAQTRIASIEKALIERLKEVLHNSRIRELTEYGRMVHAEMEALLSCARKGVSTVGATLYSTTFPCHNCAKHIIAAGIGRVVFIEPYLKSRALRLHDEAIELVYPFSPSKLKGGRLEKVKFEPFFGVGPRRFFDPFSMDVGLGYEMVRKEKRSGRAKKWTDEHAALRIHMMRSSYLERESDAHTRFGQLIGEEPEASDK